MQSILEYLANSNVAADKQLQSEQTTDKPTLKALIIDDEEICRVRLHSILKDFFDCSFAVNGREGLDTYIESRRQGDPYDFITLDINMPEMDGHQTLLSIRQWEDENNIRGLDGVKIIMTTSEGASKHILSSFRQGCEAYVLKSRMGEKLLDEVVNLGLLKIVKVEKNYAVG
jgi:two-component system chemotaxis response regulator CheY